MIQKLLFLVGFVAVGVNASPFPIIPGNTFYLTENHCAGWFHNYISLEDADGNALGYYKTRFWSINGDLEFYDNHDDLILRTDIKSFLQIEKKTNILWADGEKLGLIQQEFANKFGNELLKSATGVNISPHRRYRLYDANSKLIGISTKSELLDTEFVIMDPKERVKLAIAKKTGGDKLWSFICSKVTWQIDIISRREIPPEMIATLVAVKANTDMQSMNHARATAINVVSESSREKRRRSSYFDRFPDDEL